MSSVELLLGGNAGAYIFIWMYVVQNISIVICICDLLTN